MPRPPRVFAEGIYHLASHGSDTRDLFFDAADRAAFLERLTLVVERFALRPVAYALLGNHYHLVLATPGGRISSALQQLHGWYSRSLNRRHGRSAHLFRAHFFARELTSDADLLVACRYVAHNPVAAGLCDSPFSWPWSSAAASAGLAGPAIPLDPGPLRAALGDRDNWRRRYREFIDATEQIRTRKAPFPGPFQ
ncbi:MAG: transposase [Actinomycetota bacterium]|nr:transposase [Actinomycetota bacterium]